MLFLTKKRAIKEHRKMWHWISTKCADIKYETSEREYTIDSLKNDYFLLKMLENNGRISHIDSLALENEKCYLCAYSKQFLFLPTVNTRCPYCPLQKSFKNEDDRVEYSNEVERLIDFINCKDNLYHQTDTCLNGLYRLLATNLGAQHFKTASKIAALIAILPEVDYGE